MKRLFFLSLIILSVAMGQNWYKNRPKPQKKPKRPPPVTAQMPDEIASDTASQPAGVDGSASETLMVGSETSPIASDSESVANASSPEEIASGTASATEQVAGIDPVLADWEKISRIPFEPSPFTKLLADAGKPVGGASETVIVKKTKPTQLLPGPFAGILETNRDFSAIIGGRLYKTGEKYSEKNIKKVENQLITLEDEAAIYIMPKRGVNINIASDGSVIVLGETFKKY